MKSRMKVTKIDRRYATLLPVEGTAEVRTSWPPFKEVRVDLAHDMAGQLLEDQEYLVTIEQFAPDPVPANG